MGNRTVCAHAALLLVVAAQGTPGRGPFTTVGSKVFDSSGQHVVFRGFSLTCTEYMARPGFPAAKGDWPGKFAWSCMGGVPYPNASLQLNNETNYILNYLKPDTAGGNFVTAPVTQKVQWPSPYDQVVSNGSPRVIPLVRIPVTSGTWMYDIDCNDILSSGYRYIIDLLVQNFTSQGIAVAIDNHASCGGSKINCTRSGPMALRNYGNNSGALAFWNNVSSIYKDNSMVFYELYNEPHVWYQALYGGDPIYAGYSEMYDAVRANSPAGLVIIGATDYSYDASGPIAMWQEYTREKGAPWTNVLYNMHPYQGMFQGVWNSLRSTMRVVLALQTIGPVIWTELGQYCCNAGPAVSCQKVKPCNDHTHGDWFVHNVINLAAQLDVSWTGWGWRGTNANDGNCTQGQTECGDPDLRDVGGVLTNGSSGGANWAEVWATYVATPTVIVQDKGNLSTINVTDYEVQGFLPRPCIVPYFGQGGNCGWPLGTNISTLPWVSMWNQTQADSVFPGLPPSGAPSTCNLQACPGYECSETNGVVPAVHPCAAAP